MKNRGLGIIILSGVCVFSSSWAYAANTKPTAIPQAVSVNEDTSLPITLEGLDVDAGSRLTYKISGKPTKGTLVLPTGSNIATYTPKANLSGSDKFTFTVNDGSLTSAIATVSIMINAVNDAPLATGQNITLTEDTSKSITLQASDVDNKTLSYSIVTAPTQGIVTLVGATATYKPNANYAGADSFAFAASDGSLVSAPATVNLVVTPVNDKPVATARTVVVPSTKASTIGLSGSDVDGNNLTYAIVSSPKPKGTLSALTNGNQVTYTPKAGVTSDTFNFTVKDGKLTSTAATITIIVRDTVTITDPFLLQCFGDVVPSVTTDTLNCADIDLSKADLSQLEQLPSLQTLDLSYSNLTNISALSRLTSLQVLVLDGNNLTSVTDIDDLPALQELYLRGNALTNVSTLSRLAKLQVLELGFNTVTTIPSLTSMTGLWRLGLEYNALVDLAPLSGKTSLKSLDLEYNAITSTASNIASLNSLTGLNTLLRLEGNRLLDVDALKYIGGTKTLPLTLEDNCLPAIITLPSRIKVVGKSWQFSPSRCGSTAPVALSKNVEIFQNTPTTINLDVMDANGNALDPSNPKITYQVASTNQVVGGVVTVAAKGQIRFTPNTANGGYLGSAGMFTFSATYNGQTSRGASVNLRVIHPLLSTCFGDGSSIPTEEALLTSTQFACAKHSLTDIAILKHYFPKIQALDLTNNQITDISSLTAQNFPDLRDLYLSGNPLDASDLSSLGVNLPSLNTLFIDNAQLDNNSLMDLFGTADAPKLRLVNYLVLRNNAITDLQPLLHLSNMAILNLDGNLLTDVAALSPPDPASTLPMPNLSQLSLDQNKLKTIALPRLTKLNYLQPSHNCIAVIPTVPASVTDFATNWNTFWKGNQRAVDNTGECPVYQP
jgi:Leucine-rich repeat (LRR) protein